MTNEQLREEWRKHYLKTVAKKMPTIDEIADWWLVKNVEVERMRIVSLVKENRKGTFTDDAGHDCWYVDELVKAIHSHSKDELTN